MSEKPNSAVLQETLRFGMWLFLQNNNLCRLGAGFIYFINKLNFNISISTQDEWARPGFEPGTSRSLSENHSLEI